MKTTSLAFCLSLLLSQSCMAAGTLFIDLKTDDGDAAEESLLFVQCLTDANSQAWELSFEDSRVPRLKLEQSGAELHALWTTAEGTRKQSWKRGAWQSACEAWTGKKSPENFSPALTLTGEVQEPKGWSPSPWLIGGIAVLSGLLLWRQLQKPEHRGISLSSH